MRTSVISVMLFALSATIPAQAQQHQRRGLPFITDTPRKNWTVHTEPVMSVIPKWTHDSVPGFTHHVWAPDIIQWHGRWWMAYSCSTFGKNGSTIGLLSTRKLASGIWDDEGSIVTSREKRDNWNAIDPNFVIDDKDQPWIVWGSFWDGIQLARLDTTMHIANHSFSSTMVTITSLYHGITAVRVQRATIVWL